jgi:hypothetical protein
MERNFATEPERAYQPGPGAVYRDSAGSTLNGPPLSATIEGNVAELYQETNDLTSLVAQLKNHLLGDMHIHPPRNVPESGGHVTNAKPPDHGLLGKVLSGALSSIHNIRSVNNDLRRILTILRGE